MRNQAIILAGGKGIRMGEDTLTLPKPMVKIGRMPILWHIMKNLYHQGIDDFIILTGYKGELIREFFRNYHEYLDTEVCYGRKPDHYMDMPLEAWRVMTIDTGIDTLTAERLLAARDFVMGPVLVTYGDGLADIDTVKLAEQATDEDSLVTVTAVHPPGRFGALDIKGRKIIDFKEKPLDKIWINGGFFYIQPEAFKYFMYNEMLEQGSFQRIMKLGKLDAYKHEGFWQCMDTQRERTYLEDLWNKGKAPWRNW